MTIDGLVAAFPQTAFPILKAAFAPQATGCWTSLWAVAGIPGAGSAPSSGVAGDIPTDATAGAFPFTNPTSPALSYLGRFVAYGTVVGSLLLYDRLWQNSGLSATTTTGQTVQSSPPVAVPLTRPDANGAQVEAWWQVYSTMGSGSPSTFTITYTDQDGNTGNTGTLQGFAATAAANRTFPFSLAAGDTGVRSIQTYTANVSMTSGTMGLVQRRYLAQLSVPAVAASQGLDAIGAGLPRIYDDACLELIWLASATSTITTGGALTIAQG